MSATTTHAPSSARLSSTFSRAFGWVVAAAWRSRFVPQDGEHPAWCSRPAEGCSGAHAKPWLDGRGYSEEMWSTWYLSATLPVGADDATEPRITGALMQRQVGWFAVKPDDSTSVATALELTLQDARQFALDLLQAVYEVEAGIPAHQKDGAA